MGWAQPQRRGLHGWTPSPLKKTLVVLLLNANQAFSLPPLLKKYMHISFHFLKKKSIRIDNPLCSFKLTSQYAVLILRETISVFPFLSFSVPLSKMFINLHLGLGRDKSATSRGPFITQVQIKFGKRLRAIGSKVVYAPMHRVFFFFWKVARRWSESPVPTNVTLSSKIISGNTPPPVPLWNKVDCLRFAGILNVQGAEEGGVLNLLNCCFWCLLSWWP